jgi:predicted phosphodiesterase
MTIALISDIHGNFEALRAVLSDIDEGDADRIVCLGDVVGYYPQVNECCDALRDRSVLTLLGNHDWYLSSGGFCSRSQRADACISYQRTIIEKQHIDWLAGLPVHAHAEGIHLVHGGWNDPIDEYLEPTPEYFSRVNGAFFASGHTHKARVCVFSGKTYCNPGSVGMPRDGDPRASYALFDGASFSIRRVSYDPQPIFSLMDAAGFDDSYYGGLLTGAPRLTKLPEKSR